ncbi:MAG TPA: amino acid ABC transporter permease [Stellaceae bacterium]|jgi:His/Glu/Gln/Arg/opine family amino acid ABC transporter permease subunit|nr:amino acid ABC transporter permease [Stellaceae bacterium]
MSLDFHFILRSLPLFGSGLVITVELSLLAIFFAMVWGLVVAFGRMSFRRLPRGLAGAYIELVRDTPVLVQMYFIYFGFSMAGFGLTGFESALLALSLQNGGYVAEIYRAGIESISAKQIEGGKALGMSRWDVMSIVVLPQALVRVIPPLANQFIVIIKDTSLVSAIAVADLTQIGKLLTERTAASYEVFLTIAVFYLVMTGIVSALSRLAERQFAIYH